MNEFEKLGAFYLGRCVDQPGQKSTDGELLLDEAKDLTTHALCVGMTGSGKTGLRIGTPEERIQKAEMKVDREESKYEEIGSFEVILVRPRKSDISVSELRVCWAPWFVDASGIATPLY